MLTEISFNPSLSQPFIPAIYFDVQLKKYLATTVSQLCEYLTSRGFPLPSFNPARCDIRDYLKQVKKDNEEGKYPIKNAKIKFSDHRQTTYRKCDLAFGFLSALAELSSRIKDKEMLSLLIKRYLLEEQKIEQEKPSILQAKIELFQSRQQDTGTYNSVEIRKNYGSYFTSSFGKGDLSFNLSSHPNPKSACYRLIYQDCLLTHDNFMQTVHEVLTDLNILLPEPNEQSEEVTSSGYEAVRFLLRQNVQMVLSQHCNQKLQSYKTLLTKWYLLEYMCQFQTRECQEVPGISFNFSQDDKLVTINCFNVDKQPMKFTDWLIYNDPRLGNYANIENLPGQALASELMKNVLLSHLEGMQPIQLFQASSYQLNV